MTRLLKVAHSTVSMLKMEAREVRRIEIPTLCRAHTKHASAFFQLCCLESQLDEQVPDPRSVNVEGMAIGSRDPFGLPGTHLVSNFRIAP